MALSDLAIRQAKATGKAYTLPDIDGLSLAVSASGGRTWHFRYYWLDRQKRMSLGTYPEVSLREARGLRDEARALLAKGVNPHTHRKQKRAVVKLAGENTFDRRGMSCTNRLIAVPPFIAKMSFAKTSGATVSNRRTVSA